MSVGSSGGSGSGRKGDDDGDGDGEDEEEDEFGTIGFDVDDEEDVASVEDEMSALTDSNDVTPELASELVARMVKAATRSGPGEASSHGVLPKISPHTISVLRASRICTNNVFAAGSHLYEYPVCKKVVALVEVPRLNLSRPAREALKALAGSRFTNDVVKISCNRYQTSAENQAHAVAVMDQLVGAAKAAVGDPVDESPLGSWDEVVQEVGRQASENADEAEQVDFLLTDAAKLGELVVGASVAAEQ